MMDNILEELELFRKQLQEYYYYRREVIIKKEKLTKQQLTKANKLHDELATKAGKYGNLIADLTGIEPVISTSSGQSNIWTWALSYSANTLVVHALDQVLQATSLTLGNIQRDINLGIRDQQGNVITQSQRYSSEPPTAFIAHGGDSPALRKLKQFLEALDVQPLVVEEQASEDRSVGENVDWYSKRADCAIILATKGDIDGKTGDFIPRGNVLMEIGKLQNLFKGRVIYLLQSGTKFPTNISEKVWGRFSPQSMDNAFIKVTRELKAFGILKVTKP